MHSEVMIMLLHLNILSHQMSHVYATNIFGI